jgi:hypothetical protein
MIFGYESNFLGAPIGGAVVLFWPEVRLRKSEFSWDS